MIYGQYEYMIIDPDKLVVLPQVRKIKNAKIDEIVDSIEDRGLINPLDVAKLSYEELKNHIKFLNQLWKRIQTLMILNQLGIFIMLLLQDILVWKQSRKLVNRKKGK